MINEETRIMIEECKKFKAHPLGGVFYPDWMGEIVERFIEALLRDK